MENCLFIWWIFVYHVRIPFHLGCIKLRVGISNGNCIDIPNLISKVKYCKLKPYKRIYDDVFMLPWNVFRFFFLSFSLFLSFSPYFVDNLECIIGNNSNFIGSISIRFQYACACLDTHIFIVCSLHQCLR